MTMTLLSLQQLSTQNNHPILRNVLHDIKDELSANNSKNWSGSDWGGGDWTGGQWSGGEWSGGDWNGADWSGGDYSG
jgi:hypothetical protein